jgi:hypothetical protein
MKHTRGIATALALAALACGGAVAAASSSGGGTTTSTSPTTTTTTTPAPTHPGHRMLRPPVGGFGGGFAIGGGLGIFDAATQTAVEEASKAAQTAGKTANDAGKSPDDVRDAAVAAAKARLDTAVADGVLTKAQAASILAALTKQAGAKATLIDAAATALNLSPSDLAKKLAAGDSLFTIAKAQNVDAKTLMAAIQKAVGTSGGGGLGLLGPILGGHGRGGFGFGGGFGRGGRGGRPGFGGPHGPGVKGKAAKPPTTTAPPTTTQSG